MTWIDIVLVIILVGLAIHGMIIGLVRGIFDIIGIIAGYILAVSYSAAIEIPQILAFLLIFIIVIIVVSILGRIISKMIHVTPVGFIDRMLGGILGFLKAFIVCFVFLIILLLLQKSNKVIYKSEIAPQILKSGLTMSRVLPEKWYDWVNKVVTEKELVQNHEGVLPKSNSGMWNSKMSLRGAQRRGNLMKYNEIATPRPLQFLMVGVRNDKKGFGQHTHEDYHFSF